MHAKYLIYIKTSTFVLLLIYRQIYSRATPKVNKREDLITVKTEANLWCNWRFAHLLAHKCILQITEASTVLHSRV